MAIQSGPFKFTGSLGDLSFYYNKQHGYLVRTKGGGKGSKLSPRTRENGTEFGEASRVSKLIRHALNFSFRMKGDSTVQQRLNSCMRSLLRYDKTSARGKRNVAKALTDPEAMQELSRFAFYTDYPFTAVLHKKVKYDAPNRSFTLADFLADRDLNWPGRATHVQLWGTSLLFESHWDAHDEEPTEPVVLSRNSAVRDVVLTHEAHDGNREGMLQVMSVVFFEEVNGELVRLKEGMSLGVL